MIFKEAYTYFTGPQGKSSEWVSKIYRGIGLNSKYDERYEGMMAMERYLEADKECYILGTSTPSPSGPVLSKGNNLFHISNKPEMETANEMGKKAHNATKIGAVFIFIPLVILASMIL